MLLWNGNLFASFLPVLQPRNVFLEDLGAIRLKCNHQGRQLRISQCLWEGRSLPLMGAVLQVVKLSPVLKIWENCLSFLFWGGGVKLISKERWPKSPPPHLVKASCPFFQWSRALIEFWSRSCCNSLETRFPCLFMQLSDWVTFRENYCPHVLINKKFTFLLFSEHKSFASL